MIIKNNNGMHIVSHYQEYAIVDDDVMQVCEPFDLNLNP